MKYIFFLAILISSISNAKPMALSGKITDLASGTPIQSQNVLFKVSISSISNCVVYEEQFTYDMSGTNGFFKIPVGSGIAVFNGNGVPANTYSPGSYYCKDGSQWVAGTSDLRKITVSVKIEQDPWVEFSSDVINSVAYAESAERLNGFTSSSFLKIVGSVTQNSLEDLLSKKGQIDTLIEGTAQGYVKSDDLATALNAKQDKLTYTAMNPLQNLNDVQNKTQARTNLGLGALAILNQVNDAQISGLQWSKILQKPTVFPPEDHSHATSQIIGLNSALNAKQNSSMMTAVRCTFSQTISYNSVLDRFECQDINLTTKIAGASIVVSSLTNNDGLFFDAASASWMNKQPTIGGYPIKITSIKKNDIIKFNDVTQVWENSVPESGTIIGSLITHTGRNCPAKTILANGQLISKAQYPELLAAYTEGGPLPLYGESGANFYVPNYMGRFLRGAQNTIGSDPDFSSRDMSATSSQNNPYKVGSYQADEIKRHSHQHSRAQYGIFYWRGGGGDPFLNGAYETVSTADTGGSESRPRNMNVLYCIYAGK